MNNHNLSGTHYRISKHSILPINNLGTTSKPNRRLTGGSVRFRPVPIVLNNGNRPEPDGIAGQLAVGFWSRPLSISMMNNYFIIYSIDLFLYTAAEFISFVSNFVNVTINRSQFIVTTRVCIFGKSLYLAYSWLLNIGTPNLSRTTKTHSDVSYPLWHYFSKRISKPAPKKIFWFYSPRL